MKKIEKAAVALDDGTPTPGSAKLLAYIREHYPSIPKFCEAAGVDRLKTQRVIADGYSRMDVDFALAIERATNGEISVKDWATGAEPTEGAA